MSSRARTSKIALKAASAGGRWRSAFGALLWALCAPLAAQGPLVLLEPVQAPPGSVVICRLIGALPPGAVMAGFQQEAGFYISSRGPVALLAVPLGTPAGHQTLTLHWSGGESRWDLPVLPDKHRPRRLRVPALRKKLRASRRAGDAKLLQRRLDPEGTPPLWTGPWRWPLDGPVTLTSAFGLRRDYNHGRASWRHLGLDLRAAEGSPVLAPADGVVRLARAALAATGGTLVLGHGYGVSSLYFHLQRLAVVEGARVRRGDLLGYSGSSGIASGPHLHWQVDLHGEAVDPESFLQRAWPAPMNPLP